MTPRASREAYVPAFVWDRPDPVSTGEVADALNNAYEELIEEMPRTLGAEDDADPATLLAAMDAALAAIKAGQGELAEVNLHIERFETTMEAVRDLATAYAGGDDALLPDAVQAFLDAVGSY